MAKKVKRFLTADFVRKPLFWLLITALLGGAFRFYNLDWDFQHSFHPDERNILGQTAGIQPGTGYRVNFFAYGQFSVYLYRATGELVSTPQALFNLLHGNGPLAQAVYWLFLAIVFGLIFWFFSKEKHKLPAFGISAGAFVLALLVKLNPNQFTRFDIFNSWFAALEGQSFSLNVLGFHPTIAVLAVTCLLFVAAAAFGVSALASHFLEMEWVGPPLYAAAGSVAFFGILPGFLPDQFHLTRALAAVAFTFLLLTGALWLAWASRWGRVGLAVLAVWIYFASRTHGGSQYVGYGETMLIGRWWAALFSTATIVVVYHFVLRTYKNTSMALLAAASFAFAAVSIEQTHYCITESFITLMCVVVAFCSSEIVREKGSWRSYLLAGGAFGIAMAAKTSSLFYILIILVGHLALLSQKSPGDWEKDDKKERDKKDFYSYLTAGFLAGVLGAFYIVAKKLEGVVQDLFYWVQSAGETRVLGVLALLMGMVLAAVAVIVFVKLFRSGIADWIKFAAAGVLAVFLLGIVAYQDRMVIFGLFSPNQLLTSNLWLPIFFAVIALGVYLAGWGVVEFKALRGQMPEWIKLAAAMALSFFLFCLFSPWSLLDLQGFMGSQNYEWHTVSIADACYVLQFKDTPRYLFQLWNLMSVELWWPLGITVVLGMVWVLGRFAVTLVGPVKSGYLLPLPFARGKGFKFSLADLLLLAWFVAYFGFIGAWNTKFIRYMVPLIPAFCIFGARFLTDVFQWMKPRFSFERFLKPVVFVLVIGSSLFYSMAYMHVYRFLHPWIESSIWIFKNVPQNSMILKEAWDDGLPTGVDHQMDPRVEGAMGPQNYRQQDITVYETHGFPTDNTPIKKNYYANLLPTGDYISIASKKLWYTITDSSPEFRPNGFNIYPVSSRYYRCLWSGLLGYKMVGEFHNFPSLLGWVHPDDMAEESFSVYDHPRVYFFKKIENVSPERILKLLETDDYVKGINRDIMRTITPDNVDAFIAERHKYLEDRGLLKQLDEAVPVTVAALPATAAKPPPPPQIQRHANQNHSKKSSAAPVPTPVPPAPEITINAPSTVPGLPSAQTLQVLKSYSEHPVIEDTLAGVPVAPEEKPLYQWWAWSVWLAFLILLGWLALPLSLKLMAPLPSAAYSLSKILGFFVFAWIVWFFTSVHFCKFTLGSCWGLFFIFASLSCFFFWRDRKNIKSLYAKFGKSWLIQEGAFVLAFAAFTLVKIYIPHIHDPVGEGYNGGGEAAMDFGFLATVVRGETFPPQNMWMAGQPIGYTFYYGHLMMGILTKTLGLIPAVTYNLGLITLFATIFSGAFGLAYALSGRLLSGWVAGFLCALAGNLAGAKQYMEVIHQCFASMSLGPLTSHTYDFFGPTRVIPPLSINEFPYFSVLYGDMHAHTLAMPFAMLLIGILASMYMAPADSALLSRKELPTLIGAGFLLGGIAFLNTWEVPTWLVLAGIVLLVRHLSKLNGKILTKGLSLSFGGVVAALTLLGWWFTLKPSANPQALGGGTPFLLIFGAVGLGAAAGWLFLKKPTAIFSKKLLMIAASLGLLLGAAGLLWAPFFSNFHPQQSTVLWVLPTIRTSVRNYFSIYGLFLMVVLLSFIPVYSKDILVWIGNVSKTKGRKETLLDKFLKCLERIVSPQGAVQGMVSLGLFSLAVIWGASWAHWTEPVNKMVFSRLFAAVAVALLVAVYFLKNRLEAWLALIAVVLLWMGVLVVQGIHLVRDLPPTLNLGLFSILWLLAFFHLGLAVKVFQNRGLSFAYILVSFFFFVTAALEVFSMSEYFGFGEGMRNNSLFKYGINAWTLASVGAGVFAPKIFDFIREGFKTVKNESPRSRRILLTCAGIFLFVLLWAILDAFLPYMRTPFISIVDIVMLLVLGVWGYLENWFKDKKSKKIFTGVLSALILISVFAALPQGFGRIFGLLQNWGSDLDAEVLFAGCLSCIAVGLGVLLLDGKKNTGRRMAGLGWISLIAVLTFMVSIYPYAASIRKCHGFLTAIRQQWGGFVEDPTLNGLSFIRRANPADDAAIRFLNDHVPGQPCLVEFVGAGYNTWGSRFSIFTGIPALMGWDGHVGEWVGARLGDDIRNRVSAVEQIFEMTDPVQAKRMLDAYGVRLVMVGTVERHGAAEKPGYPEAGLAKFQSFLPLIYKNPQVEIYYNPPSVN